MGAASEKNGIQTPRKATTLGPVQDLEAHVPREWWRHLFTGLYLKTDGDVVLDDALTRHEVDEFIEIGRLQADQRILDLCCGQGRHTLELARRGFARLEGLDRSHHLVQRARRVAKAEGLNLRFREGDARRLPQPDNSLDRVLLLGNSFGYFDSVDDDLLVLREIGRVLAPGGQVLIDVSDGDHVRDTFQPRAWEWIDSNTFVCRERSLSADGQRLISRELISHAERGVLVDQFYAERLYSRDGLAKLLERAGFVDPRVHRQMDTVSQRNQDLGMMSRRLILTAAVDKASNGRGPAETEVKRLLVLMGDPSMPDPVKPDSVFDADDVETIDRLQQALSELPQYSVETLNQHDSMLDTLQMRRGQVDLVFNLCDEGFHNRASWELHVPAMLEMMQLPYTGAGPQSLAMCYDKSLVREIARSMGIAVADGALIRGGDSTVELPAAFPVLLKPNFGDSSVGITADSVVDSPDALLQRLAKLRRQFGHELAILAEAFLPGKDLTVGIIGNPPEDYRILPVVEEDYSSLPEGLPKICGYEAKWNPDSPYWQLTSKPADLPAATLTRLHADCVRLFQRLGCRDYARFDWRLDEGGTPRLLEVNPNPGWCWDGHLAKMAEIDGLSYAGMLDEILKAASSRLRLEQLASLN